MLIPKIVLSFHQLDLEEPLVEIGWNEPPRVPNPSKAEMDRCPDTFRCFTCLERKGKKKHFGGEVCEMRICRNCYPYCDEATVRGLIWFEKRHGFGYLLYPQDKM